MGPFLDNLRGRFRSATRVIDPSRFPRGMQACIPFLDPTFTNIVPQTHLFDTWPIHRGVAVGYRPSEAGWGVKFSGATGSTNVLGWRAKYTSIFSIEALFVTGSTVSNLICEFNNNATATTMTTHQALAFNGAGQLTFYVFDGSVKVAADTTTTYQANTLYHACGVADGTAITLYLNGKPVASTACGPSPNPWNAGGPYFVVGAGTHFQLNTNLAADATVLHAGWADLPWTPAEVWERANDPFSYLRDTDLEFLTGSAALPPVFRASRYFTMFPP